MSDDALLLPDVDHPLYGGFWAAAAEHRLAMQRCGSCGYVRWPPDAVCPECLSDAADWTDLSGNGTVWSVAVYEHAFHPSLRDQVPYTCALVELIEGPRLISRLVGVAADEIQLGMAVSARFVELSVGVTAVYFEPARAAFAFPQSSS